MRGAREVGRAGEAWARHLPGRTRNTQRQPANVVTYRLRRIGDKPLETTARRLVVSPSTRISRRPGGVMMAQEFFPQRVLGSEERSGDYVRASMCALREKGQARARPAPCVTARHHNRTNK